MKIMLKADNPPQQGWIWTKIYWGEGAELFFLPSYLVFWRKVNVSLKMSFS
jgi:hypothetical protein